MPTTVPESTRPVAKRPGVLPSWRHLLVVGGDDPRCATGWPDDGRVADPESPRSRVVGGQPLGRPSGTARKIHGPDRAPRRLGHQQASACTPGKHARTRTAVAEANGKAAHPAISASRETVFMLRAVPSAAARMRSLVAAMPDP